MKPADARAFTYGRAQTPGDAEIGYGDFYDLSQIDASPDLYEARRGREASGAFGHVKMIRISRTVARALSVPTASTVAVKLQPVRDKDVYKDFFTIKINERVFGKPILSSKPWLHEMFVGSLLAALPAPNAFVPPLLYFEESLRNSYGGNQSMAGIVMPRYVALGGPDGAFDEYVRDAATLAAFVLQALASILHAQREFRFVHRDLHMGNVFVEQIGTEAAPRAEEMTLELPEGKITIECDFRVKIGDFGLSRAETPQYILNLLFDAGIARNGAYSASADVAMLLGPSLAVQLTTTDVDAEDYYYILREFLGMDTSDLAPGSVYEAFNDIQKLFRDRYNGTRPNELFSASVPPIRPESLFKLAKRAGFAVKRTRTRRGPPRRTPTKLPWLHITSPQPDVHIARVNVEAAREAGFQTVSAMSKFDVADFLSDRPGFAFNGTYFNSKHTFTPLGYSAPVQESALVPELYRDFFGTIIVSPRGDVAIDPSPPRVFGGLAGVMKENDLGVKRITDRAVLELPAGPLLIKDGKIVFNSALASQRRTIREVAASKVRTSLLDDESHADPDSQEDDESAEDDTEDGESTKYGGEGDEDDESAKYGAEDTEDGESAEYGDGEGDEDDDENTEDELTNELVERMGMAPDEETPMFSCAKASDSSDDSNSRETADLARRGVYVKANGVWTRTCNAILPGELLHANQRNPRSALLTFEDGSIEVVVVNGVRNTDYGEKTPSDGMTLVEFAEFLQTRNPVHAINLDGGTSSNFAWSDGAKVRNSSRSFSYPVAQIFAIVQLTPEERTRYDESVGSVPFSKRAFFGE